MNKKILLISILAVFMLLMISYASAVNINANNAENKESPLFGVRTRRAISEKIGSIIKNIKARFLGERIFHLPFQWIKSKDNDSPVLAFSESFSTVGCFTCSFPLPCTKA